jgi:methylated-DNA-[protein]-cysteine S-methyltransferase
VGRSEAKCYIPGIMPELNFTLFETAIGAVGIVWNARGIVAVQIPEVTEAATRERLLKRYPAAQEAAPSAETLKAIEGISALLRGEARDLTSVVIDNSETPEFNAKVYAIARTIPPGRTMTYGEIAERLGDKLLAREVGTALGQNPCPIVMPCHRVLAAGGKSGGFSASGGVVTKLRLLTIEGAQPGGPTLFDALPLEAKRRGRR